MPNALRDARDLANLSLDEAFATYFARVPESWRVSRATIARLEGKDPAKFDAGELVVAAELARIYGSTFEKLFPEDRASFEALRRLTHRYAAERRQQGTLIALRDRSIRPAERRRTIPVAETGVLLKAEAA